MHFVSTSGARVSEWRGNFAPKPVNNNLGPHTLRPSNRPPPPDLSWPTPNQQNQQQNHYLLSSSTSMPEGLWNSLPPQSDFSLHFPPRSYSDGQFPSYVSDSVTSNHSNSYQSIHSISDPLSNSSQAQSQSNNKHRRIFCKYHGKLGSHYEHECKLHLLQIHPPPEIPSSQPPPPMQLPPDTSPADIAPQYPNQVVGLWANGKPMVYCRYHQKVGSHLEQDCTLFKALTGQSGKRKQTQTHVIQQDPSNNSKIQNDNLPRGNFLSHLEVVPASTLIDNDYSPVLLQATGVNFSTSPLFTATPAIIIRRVNQTHGISNNENLETNFNSSSNVDPSLLVNSELTVTYNDPVWTQLRELVELLGPSHEEEEQFNYGP